MFPRNNKIICKQLRTNCLWREKGRQSFQGRSTQCAEKAVLPWLTQRPHRSVSVPSHDGLRCMQRPGRCAKGHDGAQLTPMTVTGVSQEGERYTLINHDVLDSAMKWTHRHSLTWLLNCILFFILFFRWTARNFFFSCQIISRPWAAQNKQPRIGQTWSYGLKSWPRVRPTSKNNLFFCVIPILKFKSYGLWE